MRQDGPKIVQGWMMRTRWHYNIEYSTHTPFPQASKQFDKLWRCQFRQHKIATQRKYLGLTGQCKIDIIYHEIGICSDGMDIAPIFTNHWQNNGLGSVITG